MTENDQTEQIALHRQKFMTATKGVPAHHLSKALGTFTPGIEWAQSPKGHMADQWAKAVVTQDDREGLPNVDLEVLVRRANSRARGEQSWSKK